jgi:hypothetical protein
VPLIEQFLQMLKWLGLFSAAIAAVAVAFVAYSEGTDNWNVLIATAIGVGFTVLLGTGLMMLTFLSSRSGHDDEVSHRKEDE